MIDELTLFNSNSFFFLFNHLIKRRRRAEIPTLPTMQVSREEGVIFWDRIKELRRHKLRGEVVTKGSTEGRNILRIHKPSAGRDKHFITVDCVSQKLLNANLINWPSAVSDDGTTIEIWFFDFSLGRKGEKRKFDLIFFDALSAERFFESFCEALPSPCEGVGYWEMRINDSEDEESDEAGRFGPDDDGSEGGKEEKGGGVTATDSGDVAEDELARIIQMEENWGNSQQLFNPLDPSDFGFDNN